MSAALTILLITVAGAPPDDPFTPAVRGAIRQALGPETNIVQSSVPELPSDADAIELGARSHADVIVEVTWTLPEHLSAAIRLERTKSGRWTERQLGFQAEDDPVERSRTVGFTVASMLPEYFLEPAEPARKPAAVPRAEPVPNPSSSPKTSEDRGNRTPEEEGGVENPTTLSAAAVAAFGVGDYGTSIGGGIDFRRRVAGALSLRIGGSARVGQNPPTHAVTRFYSGGIGLALNAWSSSNARAAFGFRLDASFVAAEFSRVSATDSSNINKFKWMPAGDLLVETCFFFTPGAALYAAGGAEAVAGRTDVLVDGQKTTTYEPIHPLVELGLRAGF